MEIIRRILLAIGLLGGVLAFVFARPVLVSVSVEDFAAAKARAESRPTGFLYREKSLEEFYASRSEGRRRVTTDAKWLTLHEQMRGIAAGTGGIESQPDGAPSLASRAGSGYTRDRFYFLPGEDEVAEIAAGLSDVNPLLYLQFASEGPEAPTLTFIRHDSADLIDPPPSWLLRPWRPWSGALIVLGFSAYILLPWPRRKADTLRTSRAHAVVLPDLLGALLLMFFFILPILVIQSNGATFSFDGGAWFVPIAVCWTLALFPIVILGIAAWNASFAIDLEENRLRIRSWMRLGETDSVLCPLVNPVEAVSVDFFVRAQVPLACHAGGVPGLFEAFGDRLELREVLSDLLVSVVAITLETEAVLIHPGDQPTA